MTSRPLAVLFDLDGTLIDSIELILNSARHAFTSRQRTYPSDEAWLAGVGTPLRTAFATFVSTESDVDDLIAGYREYQLEHHDRLVRCYDRVLDTVDQLHNEGHPLAVVTSKGDVLTARALTHVGLARYFSTVITCDSLTRHKPDPAPVQLALELLGYEPADAVFVGDSVHDILAGNAAGVQTIAALWGPFTRAQLEPAAPTYYLESIADLPRLLADQTQSTADPS